MFLSYNFHFKDGEKIIIYDINEFNTNQKNELRTIINGYTKREIRLEKYGKDITTIDDTNKEIILNYKVGLFDNKNASELISDKLVIFSEHSIERLIKRKGSNDESVILNVVEEIINSNRVIKGQWKGYNQLTYTFENTNNNQSDLISIAFLKSNAKVITIVNNYKENTYEQMEYRLIDNPNLTEVFARLESKLK